MHLASRKEEDNSHGLNSPTNKGPPNGVHATNEHQTGIPNGIPKQINNVSNHIGKVADATKNINGIAQGNYLICKKIWNVILMMQ